jgi:hypothetical protein
MCFIVPCVAPTIALSARDSSGYSGDVCNQEWDYSWIKSLHLPNLSTLYLILPIFLYLLNTMFYEYFAVVLEVSYRGWKRWYIKWHDQGKTLLHVIFRCKRMTKNEQNCYSVYTTCGGHSVGIVRLRTKGHRVCLFVLYMQRKKAYQVRTYLQDKNIWIYGCRIMGFDFQEISSSGRNTSDGLVNDTMIVVAIFSDIPPSIAP